MKISRNFKDAVSWVIAIITLISIGYFVFSSVWLLDKGVFFNLVKSFDGSCDGDKKCEIYRAHIEEEITRVNRWNKISGIVGAGGFIYLILKRPRKSDVLELP